jgi:hypothetical protein
MDFDPEGIPIWRQATYLTLQRLLKKLYRFFTTGKKAKI